MNSVTSKAIHAVMVNANASGLFVSLCTIQAPSGNVVGAGQPDGLYNNIAGLVNIPCTAPPQSTARILAGEQKALAEILQTQPKHVLLNGFYGQAVDNLPNGFDGSCQAVIDGIGYDILGVEHDSQMQMTRMEVRLAEL
jgi:hypothetical protein